MSASSPLVLLVSSNGAGMGHLARLLAYARRLPDGVRPYVLSMSQAVPVVEAEGIPWEYLPSQGATGLTPSRWRELFTDRMVEVLERLEPAVLVFDGTHPYAGLDVALAGRPQTRSVWSRRGMWRPGRGADQLTKAQWFDVVLEPGDFAFASDRGATAQAEGATRLRPVTLLDTDELVGREEARATLGLPLHGPMALLSLGAGNLNDTSLDVGAAAQALRGRGIDVCIAAPSIAERSRQPAGVHVVSAFPLSRYYRAFDLAVAAAGYNSFHELLRFGVPSVFVPNVHTSLDDQQARAEHAAAAGWALTSSTLAAGRAGAMIDQLLESGTMLAASAIQADPGNGAAEAAQEIMGLIR